MLLKFSVIWHACESWALTGELRQRIYALEMRCHRTIQDMTYVDRLKNYTLWDTIKQEADQLEELITTKLKLETKIEIFQTCYKSEWSFPCYPARYQIR